MRPVGSTLALSGFTAVAMLFQLGRQGENALTAHPKLTLAIAAVTAVGLLLERLGRPPTDAG